MLIDVIKNERQAPVMANRTLALISKILNFAIENEWLEVNPCCRVRRPAKEQQRDRVLNRSEILALWSSLVIEQQRSSHPGCQRQRYQTAAALQLQLLTAQRRREILTMKWSDVEADWENPSTESGWWTIPAEHAKNNRSHRVPLSAPALRILAALRSHGTAMLVRSNSTRMLKRLPLREASEWVFSSPKHDKPVAWIQRAVDRVRERSGLEDFRGHDLRRTAASHMAGMGIPRLVIKKILNHVERDITAVYDRHSYDDEKRKALDQWAQVLDAVVRTV
jgi:integrase